MAIIEEKKKGFFGRLSERIRSGAGHNRWLRRLLRRNLVIAAVHRRRRLRRIIAALRRNLLAVFLLHVDRRRHRRRCADAARRLRHGRIFLWPLIVQWLPVLFAHVVILRRILF